MSGRLLIVDDEAPIRRALARVFGRQGFEVAVAENGAEALAVLVAGNVDVVVSDICMPQMDGVTLLREVAAVDPEIPVILVTGRPSLKTAIAAVQHRAFQYVTKPFDSDELVEIVTRAVQYRRMAELRRQALALSGLPGRAEGELGALAAGLDRVVQGLWMAFQPLIESRTGVVFGYEALMRSDEASLPHAGAVFEAAEKLGRVFEIGRLVRRRAATRMLGAPGRGQLFINLHPWDLADDDLYRDDTPLARLAPRTILEITERASLESVNRLDLRLQKLRALGFRLAVDDLGAGYAGLNSLAKLRPDFIKLDMTLVRGIDTDPVRQKLVQSMVNLGREMGITVVAEGIETRGEYLQLLEARCDLLQGFLFARPGRPFPEVSNLT